MKIDYKLMISDCKNCQNMMSGWLKQLIDENQMGYATKLLGSIKELNGLITDFKAEGDR